METYRTCSICEIVTADYIQCICGLSYCTFHTSINLNPHNQAHNFQACCGQVLDQLNGLIQGQHDILPLLGPHARIIYDLKKTQQLQHRKDEIGRIQREGHEGYSSDNTMSEEQLQDQVQTLQQLYDQNLNNLDPNDAIILPIVDLNVIPNLDHNIDPIVDPNLNPNIDHNAE
ncbi:hypothetical protein pb186bvf_013602 [Paramecium bursaria]